jgi:uncharacterized cupin superfamily protein/catechol 2,3-dioxygenase-like lactoylglutathione lyase family enzyme
MSLAKHITGIAHVGIRVHDLARSRAFYEDLGFVFLAGPVGPEPVAILRHPSGVLLNLILNAASADAANVLMDVPEKHAGYTHVALAVDDVHATAAALAERGIALSGGPITFPTGATAIFIRDPDRNVIELNQERPAAAVKTSAPVAVVAAEVPARAKQSGYPEPFRAVVRGREKRALGDVFGLATFGVNLTRLPPGAASSVRHAHTVQDEFVYVLAGRPTLATNAGETELAPGWCAGFRAGTGDAHHLVNRTNDDVVYLEIGDRLPGDGATYPDDDLLVKQVDGAYRYTHKDGTPY